MGGAQRRLAAYVDQSEADLLHQVYAMDGCYDALSLNEKLVKAPLADGIIPKNSFFSAVSACRKALKSVTPDLLVTYNWGSIEWNCANRWPRRCPMIHIQDGFAKDERAEEKSARRRLRRWAYRGCEKVVVPSNTLREIAADSWRLDDKTIAFIPNGVDVGRFSGVADTEQLARFGLTLDHQIIGTIARLTPEKNLGCLIEAFSHIENKYPNARLVIIGDGVGMSALKMLSERICMEGRVVLAGAMEQPERLLPAFTIFALSSETEQMPLSVLEAMMAGKPVVSTDVGDIAAMVAPTNRPFIQGDDATALAANLDTLLADPSLLRDLGEANAVRARECYSLDAMTEAYDRLFTDTIN